MQQFFGCPAGLLEDQLYFSGIERRIFLHVCKYPIVLLLFCLQHYCYVPPSFKNFKHGSAFLAPISLPHTYYMSKGTKLAKARNCL